VDEKTMENFLLLCSIASLGINNFVNLFVLFHNTYTPQTLIPGC